MINQAVQAAMNEQIRHEFNSAHFYLSASDYFESIALSGFAQWMRLQSREEVVHALTLFDFLLHARPAADGRAAAAMAAARSAATSQPLP
jgi:ferritin